MYKIIVQSTRKIFDPSMDKGSSFQHCNNHWTYLEWNTQKKKSTVPDFFILQKSIRCQSQRLDRPTTSKSIFESKHGHFNKCLCCAYIRWIAEGKRMCRSTSRLITNHFTKHEKSIFSTRYSERKNLIFCNKNFSKSKAKFSHFFLAFSFVNFFL